MKNIRNFSIIAHIDHGKTTLTDRILEFTGTVKASHATRIMDSNPIEQERGITIELAPVRLDYKGYILNLSTLPGMSTLPTKSPVLSRLVMGLF